MDDRCKWWLSPLPYQVIGPNGAILLQAPLALRYPARVERDMVEQRCTIWIDGKRLTRRELTQRGQENKMQGLSRPGG